MPWRILSSTITLMELEIPKQNPTPGQEDNTTKGVPFFDALPKDVQQRLLRDEGFRYFFGRLITQFFANQRQFADENNEALVVTADRIRNNSQNKGPRNHDNLFYYLVDNFDSAGIKLNTNREHHIHSLLDLSNTLTTEFVNYARAQV